MQDATPDREDLDSDTSEGELTVATRLGRIEDRMEEGFEVIGTALDLASKLALENTQLLLRLKKGQS